MLTHIEVRRRLRWLSFSVLLVGVVAPPLARHAEAVVLKSHYACQKSITTGVRNYVRSVLKTRQRCSLAMLSGVASACTDAKVTEALSKAEEKFGSTISKGCDSLTDGELSDPRPAGLSLQPLAQLTLSLRAESDRLVDGMIEDLYPPSSGATPSDGALDCQSALDRSVAGGLTSAFKLLGNSCQLREDAGRSVTGEVSRILEACVETMASALEEKKVKEVRKAELRCSSALLPEIDACPTLTTGRTMDGVMDCVLEHATNVGAAAIAATHGRDEPRVIGTVAAFAPPQNVKVNASEAAVSLRTVDGTTIASTTADASGHVDLPARRLQRVFLCWERAGVSSCSSEPIDVGLETVFFGDRTIDVPVGSTEQIVVGRLIRADGSPCFEATPTSEFALRGGIRVGPTGGAPSVERTAVSPAGDFVVTIPLSGAFSLTADCGAEQVVVDLGSDLTTPVQIQTTNVAPSGGAIEMTTTGGAAVTDPTSVHPGDTIHLHASFTDSDALEYRWEITRGDGSLSISGLPSTNDQLASGPDVDWLVGAASDIHQVTLWTSDGNGGIESFVATLGPIDIGPVLPAPCPVIPKLQKQLCGTGYTALVPSPSGGLADFLSKKYRNPARNSAGDACAYYNLVDPECIDLNCDGIVDVGTDPMGKCKRLTLGGWWQKNGFNPVTGLGPDVITAWYLNSNDLGFGREMHCRVTAWSSAIVDFPIGAETAQQRLVANLRADILASPQVVEWSKLFHLYPSAVACYVVNYTTDHCFNYPTNDPQNANLAYQGQQAFVANSAVNPPNVYGTVAMEFGPVEGFSEVGAITKFFVYLGHTAAGKRQTAANLDGCGPKSVPELCMSCHGGNWPGNWAQDATLDTMVGGLPAGLVGIDATDTAPTDAGFLLRRSILEKLTREEYGFSSFLPFDPDTYVFPAAAPSASQAAAMRSLNQLVLYTKPVNPIRDLINGWYSNNLATGTFVPWRPTAWNDDGGQPGDESDLYDEVYAKACRGCHAAHYSFPMPANFPSSSRICLNGSGEGGGAFSGTPTMPHAKLTYLNLWKSDFPQGLTMSTLETWYTASEGGFTSCD